MIRSNEIKIEKLHEKAQWIRRQVLDMIASARKGHIGGAFSCAEYVIDANCCSLEVMVSHFMAGKNQAIICSN